MSSEHLRRQGDGKGMPKEPEKPQIIICPKCGHEFSVLKEKKE
jgi:hypothetical protein